MIAEKVREAPVDGVDQLLVNAQQGAVPDIEPEAAPRPRGVGPAPQGQAAVVQRVQFDVEVEEHVALRNVEETEQDETETLVEEVRDREVPRPSRVSETPTSTSMKRMSPPGLRPSYWCTSTALRVRPFLSKRRPRRPSPSVRPAGLLSGRLPPYLSTTLIFALEIRPRSISASTGLVRRDDQGLVLTLMLRVLRPPPSARSPARSLSSPPADPPPGPPPGPCQSVRQISPARAPR